MAVHVGIQYMNEDVKIGRQHFPRAAAAAGAGKRKLNNARKDVAYTKLDAG